MGWEEGGKKGWEGLRRIEAEKEESRRRRMEESSRRERTLEGQKKRGER